MLNSADLLINLKLLTILNSFLLNIHVAELENFSDFHAIKAELMKKSFITSGSDRAALFAYIILSDLVQKYLEIFMAR